MKTLACCWIILAGAVASASPTTLERQIAEQERQIQRLEIENSRLRYMLTEAGSHQGDPLYGTKVSKTFQDQIGAREQPAEASRIHIVAAGETISGIAAAHGVDPMTLARLNEVADPSLIRPGERLKLPQAPEISAAPVASGASTHTIRAGENLYRVSLKYGIELEDLLAANPRVEPHRLRPGQRIRLPSNQGPMLADRR